MEIPRDCYESLVVPVYKDVDRSSCDNRRGINSAKVASKLLSDTFPPPII